VIKKGLALSNQIPHRAWRAAATHRHLQRVAKKTADLEPAEWSALCYLAETPTASSDELRTQLELQPGSLTNALGTLRNRDLVETISSSADKRAREHRLTPAGKQLVEDLVQAFTAVFDASGSAAWIGDT
jgi:DNA-binding MarR family transcriptional regulator